MKRNQDLTPAQSEQSAISNLVSKIQSVLDSLIVSPGNFDACVSHSIKRNQVSTQTRVLRIFIAVVLFLHDRKKGFFLRFSSFCCTDYSGLFLADVHKETQCHPVFLASFLLLLPRVHCHKVCVYSMSIKK